jgi:S-methylmethionine-dependent homocysteine/selenocysteine methylase
VADAVTALVAAGVDAILFNCCQPEVIEGALEVARARLQALGRADIRLGAYANAFPPQPKEATANDGLDEIRADLGPLDYLGWAERWRAAGANLIGGCCGIGPEHIQALSSRLR